MTSVNEANNSKEPLMDQIWDKLSTAQPTDFVMIIALMTVVWFLPAMLAFFFNRRHFKPILIACVPAGLSLIAWSGLMVWALTGKVVEKYAKREHKPG